MKNTISFGSVVFKKLKNDILFLLVCQKTNGLWGIPKGTPLLNEKPEETAIREVFEETGYHIQLIANFKENIKYVLPGGKLKKVTFFLSIIKNKEKGYIPNSDEIAELRWMNFKDAYRKITYENSKTVLLKANNYIILNSNK